MSESRAGYRRNESDHHLPSLVVEGAVIVVISRKSILVVFFAKGPMKTGMFLVVGRESERVFGVLGVFVDDFGISDVGGGSFVTVDHLCSELVGVLTLEVVHLHFYTHPPDNRN